MAANSSSNKDDILDFLTVICCPCYIAWWKEIKKVKDHSWKFTDIEKEKSVRKFFYAKNQLFHCCNTCLNGNIFLNPFTLNARKQGNCIMKRARGELSSLEEICDPCLLYFMREYQHLFTTIL